MTQEYVFFFNEYKKNGEFSQWYETKFADEDNNFSSAEQYMMYQKAILFNDLETAKSILKSKKQLTIKQLGRQVKNFSQDIWDKNKLSIVYQGNYLKFSQSDELLALLLSNKGKKYVEASPYDKIWGIGFSQQNALKNKKYWGQNLLGETLTKLMEDLDDIMNQ